jgi:hypothetical protein
MRGRKAEEFPGDHARNMTAAVELDRLAEDIEMLEGSDIHQRIEEQIERTPYDLGHEIAPHSSVRPRRLAPTLRLGRHPNGQPRTAISGSELATPPAFAPLPRLGPDLLASALTPSFGDQRGCSPLASGRYHG